MYRILKPVALIITKGGVTSDHDNKNIPFRRLKGLIYSTTHEHEVLKEYLGPGYESPTTASDF